MDGLTQTSLRRQPMSDSLTDGDRFLAPDEVAQLLGIGRTKVYELLDQEIPNYRVGRCRRVRLSDLLEWLEQHRSD